MLIGYARVSTDDQKLDLQKDALASHGISPDRIYEEYISGVKANRPQLNECLKSLREGDVLVVWRLDRLGRSLAELIKISQRLEKEKIGLRSLTEQIDTTTAGGRLVFHVFGAVAQFERDIISERTKAGLEAARARGHRGGRKPKLTPKQLKIIKAMLEDPTVTMAEAASAFSVAPATVYRAINREQDEQQAKELKALLRKRDKAHRKAKSDQMKAEIKTD